MIIKLNEGTAARRRVPIFLVGTDGSTPAVSEAGGYAQISKLWADWTNCTNPLVGGANGDYYVELATTEADTLGVHRVRYKSANTSERPVIFQIVAFDPYAANDLGLAALTMLLTAVSAPSVGAPTGTPTPLQMWTYIYFTFRNRCKVLGNYLEVYADDGVTVLFKAPISADQLNTYMIRDKFISG